MTDDTTKSTPRDDGLHAYVEHLYALAEREDRGALAALRRSLQDPTGMSAAACPYVVPFLPRDTDLYRDRTYFLVAALFALDGRHGSGVSLGDAYRRVNDAARSADGKDNPSIRARFVALLDAHPDDAGEHVRHAASLARAKEVALDWEQLLRDLLSLRHADRFVQRRWARDFWGRTSTDEGSTPSHPEVNR